MFVFLIKHLAETTFGASISLDFPFLFNIPASYELYPNTQNITCLEWYAYDFDKSAT